MVGTETPWSQKPKGEEEKKRRSIQTMGNLILPLSAFKLSST